MNKLLKVGGKRECEGKIGKSLKEGGNGEEVDPREGVCQSAIRLCNNGPGEP